jgi:two-component system, chemotaxis family, chemotaxis protein CheY
MSRCAAIHETGAMVTKPSILMVDDSGAVRRQLRPALEQAGLEVVEASDGSEGLWRARGRDFDLILTDVHMPAMDGLAFVQRLRELPNHAHTPVVALTSDGARTRREEGKRLGIKAWVLKPPKNVPALIAGLKSLLVGAAAGDDLSKLDTEAK